jgi:hypothetical protein
VRSHESIVVWDIRLTIHGFTPVFVVGKPLGVDSPVDRGKVINDINDLLVVANANANANANARSSGKTSVLGIVFVEVEERVAAHSYLIYRNTCQAGDGLSAGGL